MARILAAIVLAIAGTIPLSAGALSLGEIDLKSVLNQPFAAEIPIASEAPGDLAALLVEIAPVETFRQFGIDRPAFLSDFDFSVVDQGSGSVLLITSRRPVVEPFVTLLLEVSWAQGRLLREYTVLLDPPVFATEAVEPAVATPAASTASATPVVREEMLPVKATGTEPTQAEPVRAQPVEPVTDPVTRSSAGDTTGSIYGPVKRNDTLWAIAGQSVGDSTSVSRNQMMLAIYAANPEAFSGNINRLKAGMILRVPSADEVALGGREATAEVRRQNEQWRDASATRRDEPQGGRLRLVPPPERDADVAAPDAQAGVGEDQTAVAGAGDRDELQGRVSELEGQLEDSRRQLQIRDQELEALQRQLAQIASQPEAAPVVDEPAPAVDIPAPEADVEAQPGADIEAPAAMEPAPVDVTPVPVTRDEESFVVALLKNPLVYISLVIVLLLAWLLARNRSKTAGEEETVVEESPAGEPTDDGSVVPFADASSEDWSGLAEETETPLERTISTDSAVSLDESDPLAESDFHMAYGLYDQAADLLTRAVQNEPERRDLRMKLLEVYFIWEHQDGFLQEAKALQEQIGGAADPDWNKVLIMGKQICPGEDLFAGDAAPVGSADNVDLEFGEDAGTELDMALDDGGDSESQVDLSFDDSASDLDLDLTSDGQDSDDKSNADAGMLDFDLGDDDDIATQVADSDDEQEVSGDAVTMETPTIESPAIDGESTMETPTIESPAIDGESTMETPTIESPALDSESTMESPTIETRVGDWAVDSESSSDVTAEIDLDDLNLDLSGLDESDDDALDADSATDDEAASDAVDSNSVFAVDTQQQPIASLDDVFADAAGDASVLDTLADDVDSTAEMRSLDAPESEPDTGDTAEQPFGRGDTAEQPSLAAVDDDVMLDIGEPIEDDEPTAEVVSSAGGVDGATMTEVGTKLDLARAYIDMGDPDGALSILEEVLEEADGDQKQEAQKLIDDLAS